MNFLISFFRFKLQGDIGSLLVCFALITGFLFFLRFCGIIPRSKVPIRQRHRLIIGTVVAFLIVIVLFWLRQKQCPLLQYPLGMDIGSIAFLILATIVLFSVLAFFGLIQRETFRKTEFLTAIFTAASVAIAAWAVIKTDNTQYEMKRIDVLADNHSRYDKMVYEDKYQAQTSQQIREYYHRFWDFLYEEFGSWKSQIIEQDAFNDWMNFRNKEWATNDRVGPISIAVDYKTGWTNAMIYLDKSEFSNFMVHVFNQDEWAYTNGPDYWQNYWNNYLRTNSTHAR